MILWFEQDLAKVSLEVAGSVKPGERVRTDKINENEEIDTVRGEVIELWETDVIVQIEPPKLEIGETARIFPLVQALEADILALIPDGKFSVSDPAGWWQNGSQGLFGSLPRGT